MRQILFILLLLHANFIFSQDYFEGKRLYCRSENPRAMSLFNTGIETLYLNTSLNEKYLKKTADVFANAYLADKTFCDALFFTGYTLRLLNDKRALPLYMRADSLAGNKSIEFKINLAAEGIRQGNEKSINLARKAYNELIEYFPGSPEGYYGFAVTSTMFGDVDKGLENVNIAIQKYELNNLTPKSEVWYLKGILLTLNRDYEQGLLFLEKAYSDYKKDENFKVHYALCLLKISESTHDAKMKEKSLKFYNKIENKEEIPEDIKALFKY